MSALACSKQATVVLEKEKRKSIRAESEVDDASSAEPEILPEGPWRFIPACALLNIFVYLPDGARFNASLTCKSWYDVFNHPSLWRKKRFRFYGYRKSKTEMENALAYSKRFGQYLRSLTIICEHPTYSMCKRFQKTATDLIGILIWRKCQLKELILPRLHADRYWRQDQIRDRLMASFARFLRKQHSLHTFDMTDAGLNIQNGLHILDALVTGVKGRKDLHVLNLEDFFHTRIALFRVGRFIHIMGQLKGLHSLHLNYNYLSEEVLKVLSRSCAGTLKFCSVKVYKLDPHDQQIPNLCWRTFAQACPGLKLNVYFECIGQHAAIKQVLSRDMPLRSLHIWTGMHPQDETWDLTDTLLYLGDTFPKVLEELSLGLECGRETIDVAFIMMLEKLKMLEDLDVQTELSIDTVEAMLEMQREYKIGLQKCQLSLEHLTPMETEDLIDVMERYDSMIDDRGLDFQFQANEAILI